MIQPPLNRFHFKPRLFDDTRHSLGDSGATDIGECLLIILPWKTIETNQLTLASASLVTLLGVD